MRRRKRGAAYRARREARQMVRVSDIVTVTIGPLTVCTFPVDYQWMANAVRLPVDVLLPQELSTPDEVAAFFADNVTWKRFAP